MSKAKTLIDAMRLRSIPAISGPVLVAIFFIYHETKVFLLNYSLLCLCVSIFIQLGLNLLNEYQEGIKNVDDHKIEEHVVSRSLMDAKKILHVAILCLVICSIAGICLIIMSGKYWLFIIGVLSILCAWCYTGGPWPYGYHGLGDLIAFLFPGPVGFLTTLYVQNGAVSHKLYTDFISKLHIEDTNLLNEISKIGKLGPTLITSSAIFLSIAFGFLSCSVIMNDNLRDVDFDPKYNKRTLAVIVGENTARIIYAVYISLAYLFFIFSALKIHSLFIALFVLPIHIWLIYTITIKKEKDPKKLFKTLEIVGIAYMLFSFLSAIGLYFIK